MSFALKSFSQTARLRAYAIGLVTAALIVVFAIAESLTERYISDHSRLAGTAIELTIVAVAALVFSPLHKRVEAFIEAALNKRRREARAALAHVQSELTSISDERNLLRRVVEAVDHHMSTAGCAVYLRRETYVAEASSFEGSVEAVPPDDTLAVRLRSVAAPSNPRTLNSAAPGELAFPMMAGGSLVGFLTLTAKRVEYDDEDRDALGALAEAAGLALVALDPQLRPYERPRHNMPQTLTSFVGREHEVGEISEILREHRLVTLVGAGGIGKTRCALAVAANAVEKFADGVWLVDLAPVADSAQVAPSIAQALNLPHSSNREPLDTVTGYLKRKRLLLVIDNCEHLIEQARTVVVAILQSAPEVHVLTTSREGLHVAGEQQYRMPSLAIPPADAALPADELATFSAVRLFADRAIAVDRSFELTNDNAPFVGEICRRLDGIPLAVELAAARVNVLMPQQLAQKLDERFRVLTGGDRSALPRHRTMRALIDWSYDLLSDSEQTVFRKLSIFAGGCTLQTASPVCGEGDELAMLDLLSSLVQKSLLQAEPAETGERYELLESVRQYARERLVERGEEAAVTRAHAHALLKLADRFDGLSETTPDRAWTLQVEPELENWRAALAWTLAAGGDVAVGQRLVNSLRTAWNRLAPAEGRRWVRLAAETVDDATDEAIVAAVDLTAASLDSTLNQYRASFAAAQRALARYRRLGEKRGTALAQRATGRALVLLDRAPDGEELLRDALDAAKALGLQRTVVVTLADLAFARQVAGDVEGARMHYAQALALSQGAFRSRECIDCRRMRRARVSQR